MNAKIESGARKAIGGLTAVAIVSFSLLVLDQGYIAAAPRGVVEIGELVPVVAMLPEVTVLAGRDEPASGFLAASLPEVVVTASRAASQLAGVQAAGGQPRPQGLLPLTSALLK
jgi:hypothetical protein